VVAPVAFDMSRPRYARVIEQLLRDSGRKKSDLSRATGINDSTISAITTGRQLLNDHHRAAIAAFFGLSLARFTALINGEAESSDSPASFEARLEDLPIDQRRAHWFLHQLIEHVGADTMNTLMRGLAEDATLDLIPLPSDPYHAKEFAAFLKRQRPSSGVGGFQPPTDAPRVIRGPTFKGPHGGLEHHEEHPDLTPDTPPAPITPSTPIHVPRKKAK